MPTYEYACSECGGFDALRRVEQRDVPADCPHCAAPSPRVVVSAPRLALMAGNTRSAMQVNERAKHEPKQSSQHGSSCSCCSGGSKKTASVSPSGLKSYPQKRPWMISH